MLQSSIRIGKYEIGVRTLPALPQPVCLVIHIVEGDGKSEGGTFDIDRFEQVIDAFYKEHF